MRLFFLNNITTLKNMQRKTLREYHIFFKTFIKLILYWQSLPGDNCFVDEFFTFSKPSKLCFGERSLWKDKNNDISHVFFLIYIVNYFSVLRKMQQKTTVKGFEKINVSKF